MRTLLLCLFVALALAHPAESADELTAKETTTAQKLYVAKCAKCHKFYEPKNYTDTDWEVWMGKMSRRSKLKADQEEALKRYLEEYRTGRVEKVK